MEFTRLPLVQGRGPALDRRSRYASLLNSGLRVGLRRQGEATIVAIEVLDGLDHYLLRRPRETIEALAAGIITMLSRLANRNIAAREVAFRHQKPASTAEHARIEAK